LHDVLIGKNDAVIGKERCHDWKGMIYRVTRNDATMQGFLMNDTSVGNGKE
jgi:hypothetical protein